MQPSPMILKASNLVIPTCALLKNAVEALPRPPHLVVIMVGENEASKIYVHQKQKVAQKIGMRVSIHAVSGTVSQDELMAICYKYSTDRLCDAILVQLPLPKLMNATYVMTSIHPKKDVDGLTLMNQGATSIGPWAGGFVPCTPLGIMRLLRFYGIDLTSARVLVIGRSELVGKPMALCALSESATVTIAHSKTRNLRELAQQSDIIISATGVLGLLSWDDCLPHQVIVDVGIHRHADGSLHGDLGPIINTPKVRAYTPVPGGVGPMTINSLMYNVFKAYANQSGTPHVWDELMHEIDSLTYS